MLKAFIISRDGEQAVYYKDNPSRTISLNNCIALVFTNACDPLRMNLEKINDLRNTSTHFVTEEFELFYGPLFQACVKNFDDKMREPHNVEISDIIPESYLVLSVKRDIINPEKIRAKYSPEVAEKLLITNNSIAVGNGDQGSARYAGFFETSFVITKNPNKADLAVRVSKNANAEVTIVKEIQNVQDKYPYATNMAIEEVKRRLAKAKVSVLYKGEQKEFNSFHWRIAVKFYGMKEDERYAFNRALKGEKQASYVYSQQAIEAVIEAIKSNPEHAVEQMKAKLGKK